MFRRYLEIATGRDHSTGDGTETWYSLEPSYSDWALASGTPYEFHHEFHPAFFNSTGTVGLYQPMQTYEVHSMINWIDFFSGRYKSMVFVKCAYCGSTKGKYEYNLLGHPVCVCCGAEIG